MKDLILQAQKRETCEVAKQVRAERMVPAVVYGKKQENISIKVGASDLLRMYREAGESHVITLDIEGEKVDVLVHDYQRHHITGDFIHMDFYAIVKGEAVKTMIKLEQTGNSSAVQNGAIIEEYLKEIEVSVLPKNLVDSFTYDISSIQEVGDAIRIADLNLDTEKYSHSHNDEDIIAIASQTKQEEISDEAPEFAEAEVTTAKEEEETA